MDDRLRDTRLLLMWLFLLTSVTTVTGLLPPLPWEFPNARVLYQPSLVPLTAAKEVTPSDMNILSLFGWTLGGVFVVEWTASPVGPYREVAVLSALVSRGLQLGAWASHIVVTESEACSAAREVFGLPAVVGAVEFHGSSSGGGGGSDGVTVGVTSFAGSDAEAWARAGKRTAAGLRGAAEDVAVALKYAVGAATPGIAEPAERLRAPGSRGVGEQQAGGSRRRFVFRGEEDVEVEGWDGWGDFNNNDNEGSGGSAPTGLPALNLPSFSGRLLCKEEGSASPLTTTKATTTTTTTTTKATTALLRYDLLLGPARGVKFRPPMCTEVVTEVVTEVRLVGDAASQQEPAGAFLGGVLGGPVGLIPCIQVDGVRIVAGQPEEIDG